MTTKVDHKRALDIALYCTEGTDGLKVDAGLTIEALVRENEALRASCDGVKAANRLLSGENEALRAEIAKNGEIGK